MLITSKPIGEHLRDWRQRRRRSQLDLALDADISARHLSFLETGRSQPSRDMLLNLAEHLEVPLRDRNVLLVAAGFAPVFPERSLADPGLNAARAAIEAVLKAQEPWPALAIDRHWNMVTANRIVGLLLGGISAEVLRPPINVLRLSLHPEGLAPRIRNLGEWRAHLLARLSRQIDLAPDETLIALRDELRRYPAPPPPARIDPLAAVVPLLLATADGGTLNFLTTTMVFGSPVDITLSELAIESLFPADAATAEAMRRVAE